MTVTTHIASSKHGGEASRDEHDKISYTPRDENATSTVVTLTDGRLLVAAGTPRSTYTRITAALAAGNERIAIDLIGGKACRTIRPSAVRAIS